MQLIDTHAHLYVPEFDADRTQIFESAKAAGVTNIFLPAIDSSTHTQMLATEEKFENCSAMMGLHPCSVKENYKDELAMVQQYLQNRKFAAVGEIGLDFYWDTTFSKAQYDALEIQINWALQYNLPIVLHTRNAMDETIAVMKNFPQASGIFHCFSGTVEQAQQIINSGFLLGIGGVITYKNSGLDKVVAAIGISNLVLETDAPYLAPIPFRGKRNESSYLLYVVDKIAAVTGLDKEEIAATTTKNAKKLFNVA